MAAILKSMFTKGKPTPRWTYSRLSAVVLLASNI